MAIPMLVDKCNWWPSIDSGLQHHERLDGSGYPNQLKSEDTLLEVKILAVADVVEAMSSNRPYRPALGIDKALAEISKDKGKLYDPDVVDTCLELFSSGKFEFVKEKILTDSSRASWQVHSRLPVKNDLDK